VNMQSTQTEARNMCTSLFDQLIHNVLLEWSTVEPTDRMRSLGT